MEPTPPRPRAAPHPAPYCTIYGVVCPCGCGDLALSYILPVTKYHAVLVVRVVGEAVSCKIVEGEQNAH